MFYLLVENILAQPNENNILEWHYVIIGPKDSVYEGGNLVFFIIKNKTDNFKKIGYYHGVLKFPTEYPYKPPSIIMFTTNGRFVCKKGLITFNLLLKKKKRFKTNTRLCLSMSDFHPETWNPMWSTFIS